MPDPNEIVKVVPLLHTTQDYTDLSTKFITSVTTGKFKDRFNAATLKVVGVSIGSKYGFKYPVYVVEDIRIVYCFKNKVRYSDHFPSVCKFFL